MAAGPLTYRSLFSLLIVSLISVTLRAQTGEAGRPDFHADAEERYGPEIALVNGEKYFYPYRLTSGDPFYPAPEGTEAIIWINGKEYPGQRIRYDLYKQVIVLDYTELSGATGSIILRNKSVDQFVIGSRLFRKFPGEDNGHRFGQVVYEGELGCVFFWKKNYETDMINGEKQHSFSDPFREMYLVRDGQMCFFKNKRTFLKCFPEPDRPVLKQIMKQQQVKIRKSPDIRVHGVLQQYEEGGHEGL
jgi:hypothetical protein